MASSDRSASGATWPGRRWAALAVLAVPASLAAVAWAFYALGNGLVPGTVALGTVPLLLLAPLSRRGARIAAGIAVADVAFLASRWAALDPGGPVAYCEDGRCGVSPPVLAGLIREDESAAAGILLAAATGGLFPGELPSIRRASPEKYRRLDTLRGGRPGVNAVLLASSADRVRAVASWPPGDDPVPTLIFLHGFGGLVTTYVSALREAPELDGWGIVAPAYGFAGAWWTDEGKAVVARTLDTLPSRADRGRLVLVGLSNGGVGVTALVADPAFAHRFQAAVALEGLNDRFGVPRVPLLAIAARDDRRISLAYVEREVASLQAAGGDVELVVVEGDHMAFFTHTRAITDALVRHLP